MTKSTFGQNNKVRNHNWQETTSWPFTSMTRDFELGISKKTSSQQDEVEIELGTPSLRV